MRGVHARIEFEMKGSRYRKINSMHTEGVFRVSRSEYGDFEGENHGAACGLAHPY